MMLLHVLSLYIPNQYIGYTDFITFSNMKNRNNYISSGFHYCKVNHYNCIHRETGANQEELRTTSLALASHMYISQSLLMNVFCLYTHSLSETG